MNGERMVWMVLAVFLVLVMIWFLVNLLPHH